MTSAIGFLYDSDADAAAAVHDLEAAGVSAADIGFVANNGAGGRSPAASSAGRGAEAGATMGAALGGGAGMLAGLGLLAIPGLGPVVAAGWLATTVVGVAAGAGAGATAGGILGTLAQNGVSEADAHLYAEGVRRGGTLVTVRCDEAKIGAVEDIMRRHRPVDPAERRRAYREGGWTAFDETAPPVEPQR
jgi:hypothetical protein